MKRKRNISKSRKLAGKNQGIEIKKKQRKINFFKFILIIIFILILVYFIINFPKITNFAIKSESEVNDEVEIPNVVSGEEVMSQGYKYSNTSGIIISTEPVITCKWKNPLNDDGYKLCEAVFEIQDYSYDNKIINHPKIDLEFLDSENIRNIEIFYSQDYDVINENYDNVSISQDESKMIIKEVSINDSNLKRGFGIQSEAENRIKKINISFKEEIIYNNYLISERIELNKREFNNFNKIFNSSDDIVLNISEENFTASNITNETIQNDSISNFSYGNTSIQNITNNTSPDENFSEINGLNDTSNETDLNTDNESIINENENNSEAINVSVEPSNEEDIIPEDNYSQEETIEDSSNQEPGITGFSISMLGGKSEDEGLDIESSRPFAIKVTFEIPKYSSNQFDFSISEPGFEAKIDPEVSSCGVLDTENSVYYLDQDIDSSETCFNIVVNNVTLDCQGHSIVFYSYNPGEPSYGIYSDATNTHIKNCVLNEGMESFGSSYGIYLLNSDNSRLENNTINIYGDSSTGIYTGSATETEIFNNTLNIYNQNSFGIYTSSSSYLDIAGNNLSILGDSSTGIYFDTGSPYAVINDNIFIGIGDNIRGIYTKGSNLNMTRNRFNINDSLTHSAAITSVSTKYTTINNNNFSLSDVEAYAVILDNSSNFYIENNLIEIIGIYSGGFYISTNSDYNTLFNNSIISFGVESNNAVLFYENSNNNQFISNTLIDYSTYGINIFDMYSEYNQFIGNNLSSYGGYSYGFYDYNSENNIISNNNIYSNSDYTSNLYIESSFYNNINNNNISCLTLNNCYGIVFSLSHNNQFLFNNILTNGENSCGVNIYFSNNNNFFNNKINNSGLSSSGIIFDHYTNLNNFSNTDIFCSGDESNCIRLNIKNHNLSFYDSDIDSIDNLTEVYFHNLDYSGEWNFTNTSSFVKDFGLVSNGVLRIKYYVDILVKNLENESIENVNISVFDSYNNLVYNGFSSNQGKIKFDLVSYVQTNDSGIVDYSNYSVYANYQNQIFFENINLSSNQYVEFIFNTSVIGNYIAETSSTGRGAGALSIKRCNLSKDCEPWSACINNEQVRACINTDINCNQVEIEEKRDCNINKISEILRKKDILFDIYINLLNDELTSNDNLSSSVGLLNLGIPGTVEANLNYSILDSGKNIIYFENEVVPVETQMEFIKEFPYMNLSLGNYELIVDLSYINQTEPAKAEGKFSVVKFSLKNLFRGKIFFYSIILIIVFGISLVLTRIIRMHKK
jgi:hypothetical protein